MRGPLQKACRGCGRLYDRSVFPSTFHRSKYCGLACFRRSSIRSTVTVNGSSATLLLACGAVSLISPEDAEWIARSAWSIDTQGYVSGARGRLHVLIARPAAGTVADHRNRNRLDNRRENLRCVSAIVNARNHGRHSTNTSGVTGVCFDARSGRWRAYIDAGGRHELGTFRQKDEAVAVRKQAEAELWGAEQ